MIQIIDELVKCKYFIDVAGMAVGNYELFPNGGAVAILLDEAFHILDNCIKELDKLQGGMVNE